MKKVGEEATEIVIAAKNPNPNEIKYEIADFLYHMMVLMAQKGIGWEEITEEPVSYTHLRLHPRDQKIYDGGSRAGCKGSAAGELQKQADVRMQPADAAFLGGNAPAAAGRDALGSSEDAEERK